MRKMAVIKTSVCQPEKIRMLYHTASLSVMFGRSMKKANNELINLKMWIYSAQGEALCA
jgi:hypothetical protein